MLLVTWWDRYLAGIPHPGKSPNTFRHTDSVPPRRWDGAVDGSRTTRPDLTYLTLTL
jgi:hypothetical protein